MCGVAGVAGVLEQAVHSRVCSRTVVVPWCAYLVLASFRFVVLVLMPSFSLVAVISLICIADGVFFTPTSCTACRHTQVAEVERVVTEGVELLAHRPLEVSPFNEDEPQVLRHASTREAFVRLVHYYLLLAEVRQTPTVQYRVQSGKVAPPFLSLIMDD